MRKTPRVLTVALLVISGAFACLFVYQLYFSFDVLPENDRREVASASGLVLGDALGRDHGVTFDEWQSIRNLLLSQSFNRNTRLIGKGRVLANCHIITPDGRHLFSVFSDKNILRINGNYYRIKRETCEKIINILDRHSAEVKNLGVSPEGT
jgi:hypothetical protein